MSLLRYDIWRQVKPADHSLRPWTGNSLVGVDGTPLTLHGYTDLTIRLSDIPFTATVVIADGLTTEAILGLDFLLANQCILDMGKRTLHITRHPPIPLIQPHPVPNFPITVALVDTVRIPPACELEVLACVPTHNNLDPPLPAQPCILEQACTKKLPVCVARALVTPSSKGFPVRLLNPGSETVVLYKHTSVATIEPISGTPVCPVSTAKPDQYKAPISPSKQAMLRSLAESHLSSDQHRALQSVLVAYADVFADFPDDVGRTTMIQHRIHTGDAAPIRQHPRRIPAARQEQAQSLVHEMLNKDTILPSNSPWASPIVLVQKKNGTLRFCVDYRKLNAVTRKDAFPLPRVDDTLDTLADSRWFSTLDLISGYWQVEVHPEDREKTAFCTPEGLFEFKVMPFGLCNAPATFQRLMNSVLSGLPWNSCLVYLDDIIVTGSTFSAHLDNLSQVFHRIREAGLKLQPSKCALCKPEVSFLGHIVSPKGITTDPSKTDKVASWPTPTSKRDVQQFLGLANYYRRFIKDFASIASPLHRLTEKTASFKWTTECEAAFSDLKDKLTTAPVLEHPHYDKEFILDTDASATGIGAVLSQVQDDGREHVIAYASRTLSKPERRYCVTRRELLAVVTFVHHFRPYLVGRKFSLRTDHSSITWLRNFKQPEGQLARWITKLQEYDFSTSHRPGKQHGNADALSRRPCPQCGRSDHPFPQLPDSHPSTPLLGQEQSAPLQVASTTPSNSPPTVISRETQLKDSSIGVILIAVESGHKFPEQVLKGLSPESRSLHQQWDSLQVKHGKLWRKFFLYDGTVSCLQLVVPHSLHNQVLRELHDSPVGGHLGQDKVIGKLRQRFYWPGSITDAKQWCNTCPSCAARKTHPPRQQAPLNTITTGTPMQTVAVDILGPLPQTSSGNRYILVAMDYFTHWAEAYAIQNQEATTVADKLVSNFFLRFSPPERLHSDQGRQFESSLLHEVCRSLGIHKTRTTAYHPQGDGLVERFNRTLLNMLATTVEDHPATWETLLPKLCMAYNTSIQASTGYTPFYLMFGREARLPVDLMFGPSPTDTTSPNEYTAQLQLSLREAYRRVRTNLQPHTIARKITTTNVSMAGPFSQVILFGYSHQQFRLGILANCIVHGRGRTRSYRNFQTALTRSSPATANLASTLCISID